MEVARGKKNLHIFQEQRIQYLLLIVKSDRNAKLLFLLNMETQDREMFLACQKDGVLLCYASFSLYLLRKLMK